jgi:serine/threonine-protein kinase
MSDARELQASLGDAPYSIERLLGQGAMGTVWAARQTRIQRPVVVKVMHATLGDSMKERLTQEAHALARARHDNVVDVLDANMTIDGRPYLVMEYLDGEVLEDLMRQGSLPLDRALDIMRQMLAGLSHIHRVGIVHRDIKPTNIFVCQGGKVKLLDFGVIKMLTNLTGVPVLANPTMPGSTVGTPRYMAPEQIRGKPVDARTDVYAAGMTFYRMVAGRTAFDQHRDLKALLRAHKDEQPQPPSAFASLSPIVDEVVLRSIAKDPEDRYQSADEMIGDIARLQAGVPVAGASLAGATIAADPASLPGAEPTRFGTVEPTMGMRAQPHGSEGSTLSPLASPEPSQAEGGVWRLAAVCFGFATIAGSLIGWFL